MMRSGLIYLLELRRGRDVKRFCGFKRLVCAAFLYLLQTTFSQAALPDCEAMAERAARDAGIPKHILASIARVESGRGQGKLGRRAWPWTLNQAGKGMYFDTREAAMQYLRKAVSSGVRNIDVGCMQINYRWHGDQFASLEDMMDPYKNTQYAALFLTRLKKRLHSWDKAISNYHSRDQQRGRKYLSYVKKVLNRKPGDRFTIPDGPFGSNNTQNVASAATQHAAQRPQTRLQSKKPPLVARNKDLFNSIPPSATMAGLPDARPLDFLQSLPVKLAQKQDVSSHLQRRWRQVELIRQEFSR